MKWQREKKWNKKSACYQGAFESLKIQVETLRRSDDEAGEGSWGPFWCLASKEGGAQVEKLQVQPIQLESANKHISLTSPRMHPIQQSSANCAHV